MKTYLVVVLAALAAAVGETILSYAMKESGEVDLGSASHITGLLFSVVRNPYVFTGVLFLALYFFLYLVALSWADLSFVLPLTSVSYIFAAVLAAAFLHERISWIRWTGTLIIVVGIVFIALDGHPQTDRKEKALTCGRPQGSGADRP